MSVYQLIKNDEKIAKRNIFDFAEFSFRHYLQPKIITSLNIDKNVKMGIISEVKTELRKSGQLLINYAAR